MTQQQLSAIVRLMTGIGILALAIVFVRACFSPPPLPTPRTVNPDAPPAHSESIPGRY